MDSIVVADKATSQVSQNAWGNLTLKEPGVVQMPVAPQQVATVSRSGQNLVVTLKSGEQTTIGNFFAANPEGVTSDIVFQGEDGALWQAQYDAQAFNGFTFEEISSIDELIAGAGVVGSATPEFAIAGLGLAGAGGAVAAASKSSNSGGGSSDDGGGSTPGDTTPPDAPINLLVSPDGLLLSGFGEANTIVTVRDAAGNVIGTGTVGADGRFEVQLGTAQTNGQTLGVTLTDAAGNTSDSSSVTAPVVELPPNDTTPPDTPTDVAISGDGQLITGRGEIGATVNVINAQGQLVATGTVQADGSFSLTLDPALTAGEVLQVTLVDAAGNVSPNVELTAPDLTLPITPSNLAVVDDGATLTGIARAGFRILVRSHTGVLLGSAVVAADGTFSVDLDPAQANGETLDVRAEDALGNTSAPVLHIAPDITLPDAVTEVVIAANGLSVSGRGEVGATVTIRDQNSAIIGSGIVAANGTFVVTLGSALQTGEIIRLVQTDNAQNSSLTVVAITPDSDGPAAPSDLEVSANGQQLTGRGDPGTAIQVLNASGTLVGVAVVDSDGHFTVSLIPNQLDGSILSVIATDSNSVSSVTSLVTSPDKTAPDQPTELDLSANGLLLTGRGEIGASVKVVDANGVVLGTGVVNAAGVFAITLTPAQTDGQQLDVTLTDAAGNDSPATTVTAPDLDGPLQPADLSLNTAGTVLTGTGQAGAIVTVSTASGTVLGTATVGADGHFSVTLSSPQTNGQDLAVEAADSRGNSAGPIDFSAPDTQAPASVVTPVISTDGLTVSGQGEVGATVIVLGPDGSELGRGTVAGSGSFQITLDPAQTSSQALTVIQQDAAGNRSDAAPLTAPDLDIPDAPGNLVLTTDGTRVSGTGEAGATVRVLAADNSVLGSAVVGSDGRFEITLSTAQLNGQQLKVNQTDIGGNASVNEPLAAADIQAPALPTNLSLASNGLTLTGNGEAGAQVQVFNASGTLIGTGTVANDGTFNFALNIAQLNGQALTVSLVDTATNRSQAANLIAPDSTPPALPGSLVVSANGALLTGTGEAGATVTVTNANDDVLGTVVVGSNGQFSLALIPPVVDGQTLTVRQQDASHNDSNPASVITPDLTPPAQPSAVSVSGDGTTVSGSAAANSTVTVLDAQGNDIGSATADANGHFDVTLDTPLTNGQALTVVASDSNGNSPAATTTAPDTTRPDPVQNLSLSPDGATLSGTAEAGTTVEVRDADDNVLGSTTVAADGTFTLTLTTPLIDTDVVQVYVRDAANNESTAIDQSGPDGTEVVTPTDLALSVDGFTLTGSGTPGSLVTVTDASGATLGTATVGSTGSFRVFLQTAQLNAQTLHVQASDVASGKTSVSATYVAADSTAPDAVTSLALNASGTSLSGRGETGALVTVRSADGTALGTATVGSNGLFSVTLSSAQANAQLLTVVQADAAGNTSIPASITAPDLTAPTAASGLTLNSAATVVSGTGEAGASVTVRDASGAVIGTGTVNQSGQFQVSLNQAQTAGTPLQVTLADAAGNLSTSATLATPDRTPPAAVSSLTLSSDGTQVSGSGEVGASVQVRDAAGNVLGSATVAADGHFTLSLSAPQLNGQPLAVTQADAAGNVSPATTLTAADLTAPAPLTNLVLNRDGLTLTGLGEAGASVTVRSASGALLGTGTVASDGTFTLTLNAAQQNAQVLSVTQADSSNNVSTPATVIAPDLIAPDAPSALALASTGLQLAGVAEGGSTVIVRNAAGTVLGSGVAAANGSFQITLSTAQLDGQALRVTATDAAGNVSSAASYTAADLTAPLPVSNLAVAANGASLTGLGEAGAQVSVSNAAGTVIGTATVGSDGRFSVSLSPAAATGQVLTVSQADAATNVSTGVTVIAPGALAPETPTNLALSGNGLTLSGTGTAGDGITVRSASGVVLGTGTVGVDGSFSITLGSAQTNGQVLQVSASNSSGAVSLPGEITAADTTAPQPLTELALSSNGTVLTGRGEAGATVTVLGAGGTQLGTATVNADGTFSLILSTPQIAGQVLGVAQTDAAGNESATVNVSAPDLVAPSTPNNLALSTDGLLLSGSGEAGATVTVRAADGSVIGTGTVRLDGTFQVTLTSAQINGETVRVQLADAAGNQSTAGSLTATDTLAPNAVTDLAISGDGVTLTGRGEAGALVTVLDSSGASLGTARVDSTGHFTLTLNPALGNAEVLQVTQADAAGNVSLAASLTTPDFTPPEVLTNVAINAVGSQVTGNGEPGATVSVRDASGTLLGSTTVLANGSFTVTLTPAQINHQALTVTQADPPGNVSDPTQIFAPDLTPPVAPLDLRLNATGTQLGGTGEAGTTVSVTLANGTQVGSGTVLANGTFLVTISPAVTNGEALLVTLTDASNNVSAAGNLTAVDTTPPAAVTGLALNTAGTLITGTGEAGSRLTVLDANGTTLGTGTVNADGSFSISLSSAQQNGQVLSVIAQDTTGNPSAASTVTAPDFTAPAAPVVTSLTSAGVMTGTAEANSTVTIRGADNSVLGTALTNGSGIWTTTLSSPQNNGQQLTLTATDNSPNANVSATTSYSAADTTRPDPVSNLAIDSSYTLLSGRGEVGARVTVSAGGITLGTGTVGADGTFSITLTTPAGANVALSVVQTDAANNSSVAPDYTTPQVPVSAAPTDLAVINNGQTLTGAAAANTSIRVYAADGTTLLGTAVTGSDGRFSVTLASVQNNGQHLSATATVTGSGESPPTSVTAPDTTAPDAPAALALTSNGLTLTGTGEVGATVKVLDANNNLLGTATVGSNGAFSVSLSSAQLNGQALSVQLTDASNNTSTASSITARDITPPSAPAQLAINATGTTLSGSGEVGATVTVYNASGVSVGTAVVGSNGQFAVTLSPAQANGQALTVSQTDTSSNTSASTAITAPDITPPAAPTSVAISANGGQVTGAGQVGATVTVTNASGTVLGTGTVGANGLFAITLSTAQINTQVLSVTLSDPGGNSTAASVTAPDLTPPAAVTNLVVSSNGTTLTGSGEANATVTVKSASGTVLGTATVASNGTFTVTLSPAQINGESLVVSQADRSLNVSPTATTTAPDLDANLPLTASSNLTTATVNLAPVTSSQTYSDTFSILVGVNASKTFTWTVASGTTVDPTLTLNTGSVVGLLDAATYTLQVKNASGTWVTLATGTSQGLIDIIVLGQGIQVDIGTLQAGDYRLIVSSGLVSVLGTITTQLQLDTTSLTQFTGTSTAVSGNVITDPGIDGTVDSRGPDSLGVLMIQKNGSYVAATSTGTTVQGLYGTLVIKADGSYTYTPNGSVSSVGKVDVFSYELLHSNGSAATATLYVRIDSPQATEVWSSTNLGAAATVVDATNDIASSNVTLVNLEASSTAKLGDLSLPLISLGGSGTRTATYTTSISTGTTADLQVVLTSSSILSLLSGASVALYKQNASGQYVLVETVSGSSLVSLLGGGYAHTFQDQTAGNYQIRVTGNALIGLASTLTTTLNTTTTYLNQYVVSSATVASGNLFTDTAGGGADTLGSAYTVLSLLVGSTYVLPGYNGLSVAGTYGTLLVHADGSYTYTLNSGLTSSVVGQHDTFTYELTHPNGTTDTATLTVNIGQATVTASALMLETTSLAVADDSTAVAATASTSTEVLQGTDGNDRLDGSHGGAITLHGGAGDDTLVVVDQNFTEADGGTGTDTLLWAGGDTSIDLGNLVGRLHNIEIIDLNDTSAVALTLNLADVIAVTETGATGLYIKGDSHDSVHLTDTWTNAGSVVADGIDYTQYTAQEDPSHHLWVQNGIHMV